ncbi:MAG: FAD-dependent monooxygenase [Rhodospirillales bacterium]|nr:FAD-dependent monooxygenase [Rhodospirillales bacterium]
MASGLYRWGSIFKSKYRRRLEAAPRPSYKRPEIMAEKDRIIIVGGGPVGYTAALNLAHYGIPFLLLEEGDEIFEDPRAGTVHPPTLEMFNNLGVTETMLGRGYIVRNYHYRDRKQGLIAEFDLGVLADDTPYPFRLMLEQHKISHILADKLSEYGDHQVLNGHRVTEVRQNGGNVTVTAQTSGGIETFEARYVIGCDGGRSNVRKSMDVGFEGFSFEERFLVLTTPFEFADHGYALTNYIADPEEWCALFKVKGPDDKGIWRILFPTKPEETEDEIFDDDVIERRMQGFHAKPEAYDIAHRNLYQVHQRVAGSYRAGKILIAGDAAHVNNPLGGMGMNFGFHDAFNLTEKLAAIWLDSADEALLDRYDRQRRTVASEYLQRQTIENKKNIEQDNPAERAKFLDDLRAIIADPEKQRVYLRRAAMIEGVARAASIT